MEGPVGVWGANGMSAGIAQLLAESGSTVFLLGDAPTRETAQRMLNKKADKGQITQAAAHDAAVRIKLVTTLSELAPCGLVIESQLADRDVTQAAVVALEDALCSEAAIALNTSAQPVAVLAAHAKRPQRIAGLHFFEPAPLMRAVEVIKGAWTLPEIVDQLVSLVRDFGHTPVQVCDAPGFVANHVGRALFIEGARIVDERVAKPASIDRIARMTLGLRMGPFELLDMIGLDVSLPVMEQLYHEYREEPRLRPPAFLSGRVAAGLLGRKSGAGFYTYGVGNDQEPANVGDLPKSREWPAIWLDPQDALFRDAVLTHLSSSDVQWDRSAEPATGSLCLLALLGHDCSRAVATRRLDARRTVAVDAASGLTPLATLMGSPGLDLRMRQAISAVFGQAGAFEWIADSPGFVAQRLLAAIVNLSCEVAQRGTAAPAEIDALTRVALGYPRGPLAWGDAFGADRILTVLQAMYNDGDPRDRPSRWLARRAGLHLSLLTPD